MATYSLTCINNRLQAVVDTIDGGGSNGFLVLKQSGITVVSIELARPCGTVSAGVLTFDGTLTDTAIASGLVNTAVITDSNGVDVVTDLSVGIPLSGAQVIISNGQNSTQINIGDTVEATAQIQGTGGLQ